MAAQTIRWAGVRLTMEGAQEFKKSMADINNQLKTSQSELAKVTNGFAKNEQNTQTLAAEQRHLEESLRLNGEAMALVSKNLDDAAASFGENSSEAIALRRELAYLEANGATLSRRLADVTAALEEQERAIQGQSWTELGQRMEETGQRWQAVGDRMTSVGKGLSIGVTAPLIGIGAAAIAIGADFENAMGTVQARTGMTSEEINKLGRSFRDMAVSGDYGIFSAREIANAYSYVATTGDNAAHATDLMRYSMVLASATGNTLGSAAYFLGNYLLKVGKDTSYAEKYINLFSQGIANTGINFTSLQNYMFRMTPAFQAFGASAETNVGIMTRLYQAGIRGAALYSGMGGIMMDVAASAEWVAEKTDRFNISLYNNYGQARSNKDILFDVAGAMYSYMDAGERAAWANENLTQTQRDALLEFVNIHKEIRDEVIPGFYEATAAIDGTGIAFQMMAAQNEGFTGSMQQIRNSMEEISLQIAGQLLPHAQRAIDIIGVWVNRFATLDERTQRNVVRFAALAAAIGPTLTISGKFVTTAGKMAASLGTVYKAIGVAGGAQAALTTKQKLAVITANTLTTAFGKLKLAMKAHPFIIAGVAIAGVAAYIGTLAARSIEAQRELLLAGERLNDLAGSVNKFADSHARIEGLAAEYRNLAAAMDSGTMSAEELEAAEVELAEIRKQLIALSDGRISTLEAETRSTEELIEAVQELNESEKQLAISNLRREISKTNIEAVETEVAALEARRENIIEQIQADENWINGLQKLMNEQTNLNNALSAGTLSWEEYNEAVQDNLQALARHNEEHDRHLQGFAHAALELEQAGEKFRDLSEELYNVNYKLVTANYTIDQYNKQTRMLAELTGEAEETVDSFARAQEEAADAVEDTTEAMERQMGTSAKWERAKSDALKKISQTYEDFKKSATNAFSAVSQAAVTSTDEMLANLTKNQDALERWSRAVAVLMENDVPPALIQPIIDGGKGMADQAEYMVDNLDNILATLAPVLERGTEVAAESMVNVLAGG